MYLLYNNIKYLVGLVVLWFLVELVALLSSSASNYLFKSGIFTFDASVSHKSWLAWAISCAQISLHKYVLKFPIRVVGLEKWQTMQWSISFYANDWVVTYSVIVKWKKKLLTKFHSRENFRRNLFHSIMRERLAKLL